MLNFLIFQDRFDILPVAELLEMRLSGIAEPFDKDIRLSSVEALRIGKNIQGYTGNPR